MICIAVERILGKVSILREKKLNSSLGLVLISLNKIDEAVAVWELGLTNIGDVEIQIEIANHLQRFKDRKNSNNTNSIISNNSNSAYNTTTATTKESSIIGLKGGIKENKVFNSDMEIKAASAMVSAKGLVEHGIGRKEIDEKIAIGYLHVNTGQFALGIEIFNKLLNDNDDIIAAYLGRGTAYALSGDIRKAIEDFGKAIKINPTIPDPWKRRGQSRAAIGMDKEAIDDLTFAISLNNEDQESYHQRGLVFYKQRNFNKALLDFKSSTTIDKYNKLSWNHLGLCYIAIGNPMLSIESHSKAIAIDMKFKEAWLNMGQAYKEFGNIDKAIELFSKSIEIDNKYLQGYYLRSLALFGVGEHRKAIKDLIECKRIDNKHIESIHIKAVIQHGIGEYKEAIMEYNNVLKHIPDHVSYYQKEICLFVHNNLDLPLNEFNIDNKLNEQFKEGWCKRTHPALLITYKQQPHFDNNIKDISITDTIEHTSISNIIDIVRIIGPKIQLNAAGYLSNKRQHAACGFAVIECAQTLKKLWKLDGKLELDGKSSSGITTSHLFGWRDLYDILIKWRQYSEPNDPVWWVDKLTKEQFEEGFGSHTPMITGQTNVIRYYPMFQRSFSIMKQLIPQQHHVTEDDLKDVSDCKSMYDLMGKDFWVVTPFISTAKPGKIMEGTRLTLQYVHPEGYEYSIRTPGTPPRWRDYDEELTYIWNCLTNEMTKDTRDISIISNLILTMTFYWYNFMPLSRGTAAVGYMGLLSMFLSMDILIDTSVPKDIQVDWEGILRPTPEEFIKVISCWLFPSRKTFSIDHLPPINSFCNTIRTLIQLLNQATNQI